MRMPVRFDLRDRRDDDNETLLQGLLCADGLSRRSGLSSLRTIDRQRLCFAIEEELAAPERLDAEQPQVLDSFTHLARAGSVEYRRLPSALDRLAVTHTPFTGRGREAPPNQVANGVTEAHPCPQFPPNR
jgi:hypothetical protein